MRTWKYNKSLVKMLTLLCRLSHSLKACKLLLLVKSLLMSQEFHSLRSHGIHIRQKISLLKLTCQSCLFLLIPTFLARLHEGHSPWTLLPSGETVSSDLGLARGWFIYALLTDVQIDFASIAIRLMKLMFPETSISLPYGSLISRIIAKFVEIPDSEPIMKHLGPFCKATVSRSKGQMRLRGTKDFEATTDPADTTDPGPSGGISTSASVSLEDVMAKLNVMATEMTTFSSILTSLQKDVKELKTKVAGSSGVDEENDDEQSMRD